MKTHAVQTNGYDCGVWILSQILAVVQGYRCTGGQECDMKHMRRFMAELCSRSLGVPKQTATIPSGHRKGRTDWD